ncbi:MAG: transcriptional repressor LexA [Pseudomonadota bacterium]|uniref:transcriptional repressor LexA n=1 Tax=Thermithiobacillus tepidarius TaxID=929 RepID=UPI000428CD04|nr:transcriptional repressor LexA [Thermithiobacillus tepidarius]
MTPRQQDVLKALREYQQEFGYAPTLTELGERLGIAAKSAVRKHVQALAQEGKIRLTAQRARGIELTELGNKVTVRLLGAIAAGLPIEAIEVPEEIEVPPSLLGSGEHYALRVKGESMMEDGILDGDIVIIEARESARPGEVVVALVDGENATLKRFYPRGETVLLVPANSRMQPMEFAAERVRIQGAVVGQMRSYRN